MKPTSRRRRAFRVKLARALLLVGAMVLIAGSSWNAMGATKPDRSAFLPGGWAVDDALAFDPFNPWSPMHSIIAASSTSATGRSGGSTTTTSSIVALRPPRIPYRPPLRTPYKPPWP